MAKTNLFIKKNSHTLTRNLNAHFFRVEILNIKQIDLNNQRFFNGENIDIITSKFYHSHCSANYLQAAYFPDYISAYNPKADTSWLLL